MKLKNIILTGKNGKKVERYLTHSNRRFFSKLQAWKKEGYRVLVRYLDDRQEYPIGSKLENDSGWYTNKRELNKTAQIFFAEVDKT